MAEVVNSPIFQPGAPTDAPPRLPKVATGPNQTWSWDITKLLGPKKWTYFYLYVVLDIFSRYAVGWMVADRENSTLAASCARWRRRESGSPTQASGC